MHDLASARAESAELLNLDPDKLTPAQTLKCDLVSALRLVIDDELARATSGSGADLGKLIVAVDHLTTFMKDARPTEVETDPEDDVDPHAALEAMLRGYWAAKKAERAEKAADRREQGLSEPFTDLDAAQARIDELEALLGLHGDSPRALPSPDTKVITPSESDITPPGEIGELVPPQAVSGDEAKRRMARVNADRSVEQRVMNAPSVFRGEPQPSQGNEPWRVYTHLFE
jgi:hypothetical protein